MTKKVFCLQTTDDYKTILLYIIKDDISDITYLMRLLKETFNLSSKSKATHFLTLTTFHDAHSLCVIVL